MSTSHLRRPNFAHTLEFSFGSLLDGFFDLVVRDRFLQTAGEIDDRDIRGGYAHGHARQLSVQLGDDLANCLGCTGTAGDDVLRGRSATSPILRRGSVDRLLGGGI